MLNPIRKKLLHSNIVNTAIGGSPVSILTKDEKKYIWFPSSSKKEIREKIWQLAKDWFPRQLPQQKDIEIWHKLSWNECGKLTVDKLAVCVESCETLDSLTSKIKNKDIYEWLHDFYALLTLEEKEFDFIINNRAIFPNQNGVFCKKEHLWKDNGDIIDVFKDILKLLENDIRDELADVELDLNFTSDKVRSKSFVVKTIAIEVMEKTSDREMASHYREALNKLLIWFQKNPESARNLFPDLYKRKYLLYDEEVIAENMDKAEQLADLLKEYDAKDLNQLKVLIERGQNNENNLLPVTQQIIASMGISSIEEWQEALKDKDLAALFSHESTPTTDMFVYAQSLIMQAKENIIARLKTLNNYDLSDMDLETVPTIIAGIKKNGQSISIVARPAYNREVIIYYGSEHDILDFEPSELWVDDGKEPRQITLGHIIKKAEIRKFPI